MARQKPVAPVEPAKPEISPTALRRAVTALNASELIETEIDIKIGTQDMLDQFMNAVNDLPEDAALPNVTVEFFNYICDNNLWASSSEEPDAGVEPAVEEPAVEEPAVEEPENEGVDALRSEISAVCKYLASDRRPDLTKTSYLELAEEFMNAVELVDVHQRKKLAKAVLVLYNRLVEESKANKIEEPAEEEPVPPPPPPPTVPATPVRRSVPQANPIAPVPTPATTTKAARVTVTPAATPATPAKEKKPRGEHLKKTYDQMFDKPSAITRIGMLVCEDETITQEQILKKLVEANLEKIPAAITIGLVHGQTLKTINYLRKLGKLK